MITLKEAKDRSAVAREANDAANKERKERETQKLRATLAVLVQKTLAEIEKAINAAVDTGAYAIEYPVPFGGLNAHDQEFFRAELLVPLRAVGFNAGYKMEPRPSGSNGLTIRWDG